MDQTLAVRALDLPLFGGIVLSLGLLAVLGSLYHFLFYKARPGSPLLTALQDRLRYVALPPVVLGPALSFVYWVPNLAGLYEELQAVVWISLLVVGLEALLALLVGALVRLSESAVVLVRFLLYAVAGVAFAKLVLGVHLYESQFVYAGLWVLLVYSILHLTYSFLFKRVPWTHPLALAIRDRLRLWAYLLVLMLTVAYATTWIRGFPRSYEVMEQQALLAVAVVMGLECILAAVFDYYFPQVRQVEVPSLFRVLTRAILYSGLILFVLGYVFHQDLSTLLVGSTAVSVILGFALQETLGNFFAGLALGVSKPYNLGDFVQVTNLSGRVEKIDWRSTALRTMTGDYTVLPNSVLAKETIINFSAPTTLHARLIDVGAHYQHPPNEVRRVLLEAAYSVEDVLEDPRPDVWLMHFDNSAVNYRLRYWLQDYGRRWEIDSRVREAIWYHFHRAGIEIPFPIQNVIHHRPARPRDTEAEVRALLDRVDFLRALGPAELQVLVDRTRFQLYAQGERIFSQGEAGESFYILQSGRLRVTARNPQGEVFLSKEMHVGDFFGEMALLTGEPRSATVEALSDAEVLSVDKGALRELLRANPDVDRMISEALARRQLTTIRAREELESEKARNSSEQQAAGGALLLEQLSEQFLRRIRDFFSY